VTFYIQQEANGDIGGVPASYSTALPTQAKAASDLVAPYIADNADIALAEVRVYNSGNRDNFFTVVFILANLPVAIRMQASDLATTRLADVLKRNAKAVERYESLAAQGLTMTEADIRFARAHAPHALTALAAASPQLLTISVASMILINEGYKDTVIPDDTDISFDGGNLRVTGTKATLWLMHNSMLWSANRLHVTGDLPQTVITGISGRRLGDIVADTGVDDLTIKHAWRSGSKVLITFNEDAAIAIVPED